MNRLLYLTLIAAIGLAIYANSLQGKFIWDDNYLIRDNVYIKDWSNTTKIFRGDVGTGVGKKFSFYRPFQMFTYMLDYSIWELNVFGYHLTNVILHVLAALLLYWFINVLYNNNLLAFLTSILFIVHPIHTEAVSYISGRADLLALVFMLLCFILYARKRLHIIMLLSYALALFSKENSLILPALIVLYHYVFKKKIEAKRFVPLLAIAVLYIIFRLTWLSSLLPHLSSSTTLLQRLPGFFVAIVNYLRLLFFPFGLHMEYGDGLFSFREPKATLGITILALLVLYTFKKRADTLSFFSMSWFFLALLPHSNIYPLNAYMAEHWLYVPSIGFFLVLANGLSSLCRIKNTKILSIFLITGLLVFYSYLTIGQNQTWREPISFYKRTLDYAPDSVRALNSLGIQYRDTGRNEEAITLFKKAIEINPNYEDAYNSLGIVYGSTGKYEEAIAAFKKALEINPYYVEAYNNLGNVYTLMGKNDIAIELYKMALEINPNYAKAHINLALIYFNEKQYDLAIRHCDEAIKFGFEVSPEFLKRLKPYRR